MEEDQQLITEEKVLKKQLGFLRGVRLQIFRLLRQQDRWMYIAEIAETLGKRNDGPIRVELQRLLLAKIVEKKRTGRFMYYRLQPGISTLYQQLLNSQKGEPDS